MADVSFTAFSIPTARGSRAPNSRAAGGAIAAPLALDRRPPVLLAETPSRAAGDGTGSLEIVLSASAARRLFARAAEIASAGEPWDVGGAALTVLAAHPRGATPPMLVASGYMTWGATESAPCSFSWRPVPGREQEAAAALQRLLAGAFESVDPA